MATGIYPYELIWRSLQVAWRNFAEKDKAKEHLARRIRDCPAELTADFPFETVIPELWLIGYCHADAGQREDRLLQRAVDGADLE